MAFSDRPNADIRGELLLAPIEAYCAAIWQRQPYRQALISAECVSDLRDAPDPLVLRRKRPARL